MIEEVFIRNLGIMVVTAAVLSFLARYVRMPSIVTYLITGLVLGPVTGIIVLSESLDLISEAGIVLLLFLVGLELSFSKIRDVGRVAVIAGLGQVVFTALGGYALCVLLQFDLRESLFLAVALTFSSTVVVVKLLKEKNELDSLYGRIAVGIFLVQDLVAIVILTVLTGLGAGDSSPSGIAIGIAKACGGMAVLLFVTQAAAKWVLPRPFAWVAKSPETLFIWSLCWCFAIVWVAHLLHLSVEIGAFLAGVSLAQLPYSTDLRRRVDPLMNFFIAIFFISLGIKMELDAQSVHWGAAGILSLFVLIGNPLIFFWIIARMGYSERTTFKTSVAVAQISEFSFIFVGLGVSSGLVGMNILSLTALVGLVTITISAYMILYSEALFRVGKKLGLFHWFRCSSAEDPAPPVRMSGHIIVVGMNTLGRKIAQMLLEKGETVVAIDTDPVKLRGLSCETLIGDASYLSVLEDAGLPSAKLVVSALQIEDANDLLAHRCKSFGIPSAIHAIDLSVMDNLLESDVTYFIFPKVDGVKMQNEKLKEMRLLTP